MDYIPREIEAEFRATCDSNVTAGRATGPAVRSVAALLSTCSPLPSPLIASMLLSSRNVRLLPQVPYKRRMRRLFMLPATGRILSVAVCLFAPTSSPATS